MNEIEEASEARSADHLGLAVEIVTAYVANNPVPVAELAPLLASTHAALAGLGQGAASEPQTQKLTAAQIKKSITHDALISFEDGKPYKTLRRHLTIRGLTPEAYRTKWGLPADYPMTAPGYSEARSKLALDLGLGRKRLADVPSRTEAAGVEEPAPSKKRGRKSAE